MAGGFRYIRAKTKIVAGGRTMWADSVKQKALDLYAQCGSLAEISRNLNVPYDTLDTWTQKDWWKDGINRKRKEHLDVLDTKLTESIDESIKQLQDRLKNGDSVYNQRTGKFTQAPAKLRDINAAFNSLVDKRNLLRKLPTKITEQQSTAAQLQNLATQFQEFVTGRIKTEGINELVDRVIEGETVEQDAEGNWYVKE